MTPSSNFIWGFAAGAGAVFTALYWGNLADLSDWGMCQTKGDQPETTMLCIRSWVGALSGWAAAVFAVFTAYKTLVPLIKQMRFQADAALIKSIEAEIVELRKFVDFDRSLEGDLDQEDIMMILMFYAKIDFRKEFQAQSDQISLAQTQIEIYITGILDKFVDCQQCISILPPDIEIAEIEFDSGPFIECLGQLRTWLKLKADSDEARDAFFEFYFSYTKMRNAVTKIAMSCYGRQVAAKKALRRIRARLYS